MPPTLRKTSTLPLASLTPPKIKTTTITIPILNNNMARDASFNASGIIKPPTRRGRPTNALRASLLAGHGTRNYISSGDGNPRPPTRIEAEIAYAEQAKAKEEKDMKKREKANKEKRNRVDDQDNEVVGFDFGDFVVGVNNNSDIDLNMDMSMENNKNISFGSTDADGSVIHQQDEMDEDEEEVEFMSKAKLVKERKDLRKRAEVLEAENASLTSTRLVEHTRLKSINAALLDRLHETRAAEARAAETAKVWEGQMMDRDGEVQRLRGLLEMEKIKEEERMMMQDTRGSWEAGGDQVLS